MRGEGFLAIWSDIAPEHETDYLHWLAREHTSERLGIDGFLAVRVFRALGCDVRRYFICYELRSPGVLASTGYLARLDAPTPWSKRIMPRLRNFARGGGRVVVRAGSGQGGIIAPVRLDEAAVMPGPAVLEALVGRDGIVAAALLQTDQAQTSIQTREKDLRERDATFAGLLLVEGLDEVSMKAVVGTLGQEGGESVYGQVFQLRCEAGHDGDRD